MIDIAVRHIASELNQYLQKLFYISEDIVTIGHIGHQCDTPSQQNHLVISVININEDQTPTRANQARQAGAYQTVGESSPLSLELQLLISAKFKPENYQEGLKFISYTIEFFQKNVTFTPQNSPALEGEVEQLTMGLETLDIQDWSALWGSMNCRSMPAVMYSAKMLAYNETNENDFLSL